MHVRQHQVPCHKQADAARLIFGNLSGPLSNTWAAGNANTALKPAPELDCMIHGCHSVLEESSNNAP